MTDSLMAGFDYVEYFNCKPAQLPGKFAVKG